MVAISSQYCFGADKAVQIRQAVIFEKKGHNPNCDTKTAKSPYKSGYQILIMDGSFGFELSENLNIALLSKHTQHNVFVFKI